MLEVDIEASEPDHSASANDINLPLIPLLVLVFSLTDGYYYTLSLFTTCDKELIPSYVDFLELYDLPESNATESKSPLEQRSPGTSEIKCGGFWGLEIAQQTVDDGAPHEMVVAMHTSCFDLDTVYEHRFLKRRFHHYLYKWPRLGMPDATPPTRNGATTIVIASEGVATKSFDLLVDEPAYLNTC